MRPVEYTPDNFASLHAAARGLRVTSLCHQPFVDHYYADNPWSKLYLVRSNAGAIIGTLGVDEMRFACNGEYRTLAFATNFHAAQPGVGGLLYLHWMKTCSLGLVFGGSEQTHQILRRQRWTYFPGVRTYLLNRRRHVYPEDAPWKRWAKQLLAAVPRASIADRLRRLPRTVRESLSVREASRVSDDMLPASSPFTVRFAPSTDYLNWRYHTGLSFARYHVFRIRGVGYAILQESCDRVIVAHADGNDATALAYGVLLSLAEVTRDDGIPREVLLACSHPEMARVYEAFGFRAHGTERPLVVGSRGGAVDLPADTSRWLVNFDWGDNGLRAPFADQVAVAEDRLTVAR